MSAALLLTWILSNAARRDPDAEFLVLRLDPSGAVQIGMTGADPELFEGVLEELGHLAERGDIRAHGFTTTLLGQSIIN
jgi:hypothetical protein